MNGFAGAYHDFRFLWRRAAWVLALAAPFSGCARHTTVVSAVAPAMESRFYDTRARRFVAFDELVRSLERAQVVFFGEQHDDPATHRAELALLAALGGSSGNVVLSLEMFERDVQPAMDAYLAGQLAEPDFLVKARPWERYTTDYRALVELARARGWHVVAANVPRRFASAVSRSGLNALDTLSATDRAQIARELDCPHDRYFERFADEMKGHSAGAGPPTARDSSSAAAVTERFYQSQCVKDETMAESVAAAIGTAPSGAVVFHVTGAFHTDVGLGTASRVRRRLPNAKTRVVSAVPVDDLLHADAARFAERGDFIILTRKAQASKP